MKWVVRALFLALMATEGLAWNGVIFHLAPDYSWLGLVVTAAIALFVLETLEVPATLRLIVFLDVSLDAFSDMWHLYSRVYHWDKLLHFLGGATVAVVSIWFLNRLINKGVLHFKNYFAGVVVSAILITAFCGMVYETQEWLTDVHYLHYQKQLGDGPDTVTDELMNTMGAITVGAFYAAMFGEVVNEEEARKRSSSRRQMALASGVLRSKNK